MTAAFRGVQGAAADCKVVVVAKPVESQLIGFNVVASGSSDESQLSSAPPSSNPPVAADTRRTDDRLSESSNAADLVSADTMDLQNKSLASTDDTVPNASDKQPVSWVESSFKHRFFGRSNVGSSRAKTKANVIRTIPWFGNTAKSAAAAGTKRNSFSFREIRQELQAVMRQNSRNSNTSGGNTTIKASTTSGLAAAIKSKTMKTNASPTIGLDVVCEDTVQ